MISEFRRIGDMLFLSHLVDVSGGNLSVKTKDGVWITKTKKSLYNLRGKDIVKIPFEKNVAWNAASSEAAVHINIYKNIESAKAIVHAHPVNCIALSLKEKNIKPLDYEGSLFLGSVDVVDIEYDKWGEAKDVISSYFKNHPQKQIVVAKGHGVFAYADTLFDALTNVSALENSCKIIQTNAFGSAT